MPRLMRLVMIASALTAAVARSAPANDPQPLAPPRWSDHQAHPPQDAPSRNTPPQWPADRYAARPDEAPPALSVAYQAPERQQAPAQQAVASQGTPLPLARPAAAGQPIPLPQQNQPASPLGGKDLQPLVTGASSLGIVLGLFLLVVWTVRRTAPRGAGLLPPEAVEVLGRVPLAGRQQAHLVRCGNKLVLVSVTTSGVEALTEITDPMEVDRLESICRSGGTGASPLKQFLARFGSPTETGNFESRSDSLDFRHLEVGSHS